MCCSKSGCQCSSSRTSSSATGPSWTTPGCGSTELAWIEWVSEDATPVWIRLDFAPVHDPDDPHGPDSVWLVAGHWTQGRFAIATDDLTVIFDEAEAARANLVRPAGTNR